MELFKHLSHRESDMERSREERILGVIKKKAGKNYRQTYDNLFQKCSLKGVLINAYFNVFACNAEDNKISQICVKYGLLFLSLSFS